VVRPLLPLSEDFFRGLTLKSKDNEKGLLHKGQDSGQYLQACRRYLIHWRKAPTTLLWLPQNLFEVFNAKEWNFRDHGPEV